MESTYSTSPAATSAKQRKLYVIIAVIVGLLVIAGGYLLYTVVAGGFFASVAATQTTPSGNAALVADSTASAGRALQFNEPAGTGGGGTGGGGTSTSSCPLPKYPNPSCTGIPAGTQTTTINGDYTVNTPNAVVSGKIITGTLSIRANGVVIEKSQIYGKVENDEAKRYSYTIRDTTVGRDNVCQEDIKDGAIGFSNYTAQRVRLVNFVDGFRVAGSNTIVEDSYVTPCSNDPLNHSDGIQVFGAENGTNIVLRHNTVDETKVKAGINAAIFAPGDGDRQGNNNMSVSIVDNMMASTGGFPLYIPGPGSKGVTFPAITGNKIVKTSWEYNHPYAVECSFVRTWSDNAVVNYDFNTGMISSVVQTLPTC